MRQGRSGVLAHLALIKVEPGCKVELTRTLEQEVIPLLREEKGFRDLLAFTLPNGTKALSLSLWDQDERQIGVWARGVRTLAALAKIALRRPAAQVYEVSKSTFQTAGQFSSQKGGVDALPDLRIYQSALRPFKVSPACRTPARGFPLVRGLIDSFLK
jgi:uroporphyrinogen-III synthase